MLKNTLSASLITMSATLLGAGLEDLTPLTSPSKVAPGIWKVTIGDPSKELQYTDYAANKPKFNELKKKSEKEYPFKKNPISFYKSPDNRIMVRIPADPKESIYGFGLQLDEIKKTKQVLNLNVDHWSLEGGKGTGRTHAPVPFYISSKGYGIFFNTARFLKAYVLCGNRKDSPTLPKAIDRSPINPADAEGWQAIPDSDAVEAQLVANGVEVYIFSGDSLLDIVSRYNLYNGGGTLPPLWGLGFWNRTRADYNEADCDKDINIFKKEKFPLDVLGLEPGWMTMSYPCTFEWQKKRFKDPAKFTKRLLDEGIRLNLWINPYVSPESRLYKPLYPLSGSHTVWLGLVPDYTIPKAQKLLAEHFQAEHLDIGVSGYKIDEVDGFDRWLWPDHATFPSGTTAEAMRQAYGLIMQKTTYKEMFHKHNIRTYGLIRSSNGAASGYPYVLYSDSYTHSQYITGISAASLSGILWTPEVRQAKNGSEWLNRFQTVCFSPLAMLNAWESGEKPWSYPEYTDDIRKVIELRMRLLPYLYTAFAEYQQKGIPPMRAMILENGFSKSTNTGFTKGKLDGELNPYAEGKDNDKSDQFMFGPSILVAPFYEELATKREVILPKGDWYDFYTGKFVGNGTTITVTAESLNNKTPLFVKDGAIIPMLSETVENTKDAYGKDLEVRIYGKADGEFSLYEDDGKTFNYEKGEFRVRKLTMSQSSKTGKEEVIIDKAPKMFGNITKWNFMTK